MINCPKCGALLEDETNLCKFCGENFISQTKVQTEQQPNQQWNSQQSQQTQQNNNTYGRSTTPDGKVPRNTLIDQADIVHNRIISILCYFNILMIIPMLTRKNSLFVRYHAKQGVNLFFIEICLGIVNTILRNFAFSGIIISIAYLTVGIFAIIGIINACQGYAKKVPFIGDIDILDGVVDSIMK